MKFIFPTIFVVTTLTALSEAQEWIPWSVSQGVPPFQAPRGREADFRPLYIIRAPREGDPWIPGKYNFEKQKAYIAYSGLEIILYEFEFFTPTNVKWVPASKGETIENAVAGGVTKSGETLYIGRAPHEGSITLGKIQPSEGALFIPYDGFEYKYAEYEQLVYV